MVIIPANLPQLKGAGGGGAGGNGSPEVTATSGEFSTGGGGGGSGSTNHRGAAGGSGVVIIRYEIGTEQSSPSGTAKATGGEISYYAGRTIHTFRSSGTFSNTSNNPLVVDHFIVGGGGSGGSGAYHGAGAGAGGVRASTTFGNTRSADSQVVVSPGSPVAVEVGAGAAGNGYGAFVGPGLIWDHFLEVFRVLNHHLVL